MPRGTCLCGSRGFARGWAQPHEAGTEPSPALRSASQVGTPPPAPANKQQRAACSAAEQLLPTNTQGATAGRYAQLSSDGATGEVTRDRQSGSEAGPSADSVTPEGLSQLNAQLWFLKKESIQLVNLRAVYRPWG